MKHRYHMIPCVLAIVVAIVLLTNGRANPLSAGVGFALLICPIVMGTVMWLLMRQPRNPISPSESHELHDSRDHAKSGRT